MANTIIKAAGQHLLRYSKDAPPLRNRKRTCDNEGVVAMPCSGGLVPAVLGCTRCRPLRGAIPAILRSTILDATCETSEPQSGSQHACGVQASGCAALNLVLHSGEQ